MITVQVIQIAISNCSQATNDMYVLTGKRRMNKTHHEEQQDLLEA